MTRSRDLADSADKDITGTLTVDALTSSGAITGDVTGNVTGNLTGNVTATTVDAGAGLRLSTDGSNNAIVQALGQDKDIYLSGDDGGAGINALILDMSAAGAATFNAGATFGGHIEIDAGSSAMIDFGDITSAYGRLYADSSGTYVGSKSNHNLILRTNNVERIRVDTSGNVGIGVAPNRKLHVGGTGSGQGELHLTNDTTGHLQTDGSTFTTSGSDLLILQRENANIRISTNGLERMRIDASGNINLPTTDLNPTITCSGNHGASQYNYFLNASNDGGVKAAHFVNGSTRTADGGANAYIIRNDAGPFILGRASQDTKIEGASVTVNGHTALTASGTPVHQTGANAFLQIRQANTNPLSYAEMHIGNDNNDRLIFGSIGTNYTQADWTGSRYIYNSVGDLSIKSKVNLRHFSGGFTIASHLTQTMNTSGHITNHRQPMISGTMGTAMTHPTNDTLLAFNSFFINRGITFNSSTKRFTVPTAGVYSITMTPFVFGGNGPHRILIGINTDTPTENNHYGHFYTSQTTYDSGAIHSVVDLSANDYIVFRLKNGKLYNQTNDRFNEFSIQKIA